MSPAQQSDLQRHMRLLVDQVPSMLAYWDRDLICRFANRAYKTWFGLDPEQVIGKTMPEVLGPQLFALNHGYIMGALQGQVQRFERIVPGPDGVQRHSLADYIPDVVDGQVQGFLVQVTEVTRLKEAEAALRESRRQLRSLTTSREEAREQERKLIAREIHDELGQLLTGLKMDLSVLKLQCANLPKAQDVIADMNSVVERTFEVVRSVATSLRPSVLNIGLVPAMEWLVEDFALRWDMPCNLNIQGQERTLDESRSTAIFRVVQESLTNIARHAQAQHVWVDVVFDPAMVRVSIRDDGVGFEPAPPGTSRGLGLLGMRERMLALGGQIQIDSKPGQGTTVSIQIPPPGRYLFKPPPDAGSQVDDPADDIQE
ncbi:MAG: PAS domain-containing protein [Acidobacteriota bacterium]